jgi:hypothetical protein
MTTAIAFSAEDCRAWIEVCAVDGVVRVSDVARSLRAAATPRPDAAAIASALEGFAAEHPERFAPRFVASAAAADGRHLVARVLARRDAPGALGAMCAKAGCPAVPEHEIRVSLDAVTVSTNIVDDDDDAAAAPANPTSPLQRMTSVDAFTDRAATRGPALLRTSNAVVERLYRTFSRMQLQSGDLSGSSSESLSKTPAAAAAPANKAVAPAAALAATAPAQPPKRAARPVDVHPEPESKTARAEVKQEEKAAAAVVVATTPTPPAPAKPKAAASLMSWLQKKPAAATPETPSAASPADAIPAGSRSDAPTPGEAQQPSSTTDAEQQQEQPSKPKRGRPVMTAEQKAEAAIKRQATKAAAIGIGAKVASAVLDKCHALIDDDDDDDGGECMLVARPAPTATANPQDGEEEDAAATDSGAVVVSGTLDADDDDAPIALAMVASVPKQTPAAAAAAARKAKKDQEEARAKEIERHQLELYEQECARIAAAAGGNDDGDFVAGSAAPAAVSAPPFELSEEAKQAAVPPPPPPVRIATSTVTPPTTRKHARPSAAAATTTVSAAQPTLAAFASSGNAAAELQKAFVRTEEEVTEQVNGEYVCRDVVVYVHRETKEQISDDDFRRRLAECMATAHPDKSPSTAVKRLAADDVDMDESAPLPTPVEPKVVQLKAKDTNATAAKASSAKPTAGKKTAKSAAPPAGTRSIASFFAPKK